MPTSNTGAVMPGMQTAPASVHTSQRAATRLLVPLLAIVISAALAFAMHPDATDDDFARSTGLRLPPGVHVISQDWTMHDNLLHVGDRWWLSGSPSALARLTDGSDFVVSTEDARWVLPAVDDHGRRWTLDDVRVGFEHDAQRNDWYLILGEGTTALYEDN